MVLLEGKVAGDMARDTKITMASINTCKNRQRGSRDNGRINDDGDANFQCLLARCFAFTEKPHHFACVYRPKKRFRGEVIETCEDRPNRVRVFIMYRFFFSFL